MDRPVGELLREWRRRRKLSQLELAIQADVSARHVSFVETGRTTPSCTTNSLPTAPSYPRCPIRPRSRSRSSSGAAVSSCPS
ncbi:helix-turn-helix domain-containing protein [Kribbella sp. WER1]